EVREPAVFVPYLQAVGCADEHDVPLEGGELPEGSGQADAARRVELGLSRSRVEEADEVASAGVRERQVGEVRLDLLPRAEGEDERAAVHAARHDHAAVHGVAEGGGNDDPSLVVDAVLELAERHLAPRGVGGGVERATARLGLVLTDWPDSTTISHHLPRLRPGYGSDVACLPP